ncbi:MAG: hypothetical protein ACK5S3_11480 [Pirellulaceae bacterium]|jgi:hypothetical protein
MEGIAGAAPASSASANSLFDHPAAAPDATTPATGRRWYDPRAWLGWLIRLPGRSFDFAALVVLLSVVAAIPVVQFASLGYLLEIARRVANGQPASNCLPGRALARRILMGTAAVALSFLPVLWVQDYARSLALIAPQDAIVGRWENAARWVGVLWLVWVMWALLRGGRLRDFLWPAPIRFVQEVWRPKIWREAESRWWDGLRLLNFPHLWWLGARAALGGLASLLFPALLMVIGMNANNQPFLGLIGLVGSLWMLRTLMVLPFLQVALAESDHWRSLRDRRAIRQLASRAPWSFGLATTLTLLLAIPLYLLRIESPPRELMWMLCLFFIVLAIPSRLVAGWAMRRAHQRQTKAAWWLRWSAKLLPLASGLLYLGFLYLATLASWEGGLVLFLQHAFLLPVPML